MNEETNEMVMSSALAAWILAVIAAEPGRNEIDVTALEMGARRLSARWFQPQRRRARRLAGDGTPHPDGSPHPEPLTPEEELADTVARQKEDEVQA